MILVTEIKYKEVPRDVWQVMHKKGSPVFPCNELGMLPAKDEGYEIETIYGQRFCENIDKHNVCTVVIGMTEEVRSVLRMPIDCFQKMSSEIETLNYEKKSLQITINNLEEENAKRFNTIRRLYNMDWIIRLISVFYKKVITRN